MSEAPSIRADSSRLSGMLQKKLRIRIRLKGATSCGMINTQTLFSEPDVS